MTRASSGVLCGIGLAVVMLAACGREGLSVDDGGAGGNDGGGAAGGGGGKGGGGGVPGDWGGKEPQFFRQDVENAVDIVFMIDNSASTEQMQANLTRNFPTFVNVLKSLPAGLPDLHVGLVTSSLGAGAFADVPGCPPNGDRGAFQNAARGKGGTCTAVPKDHYIISLEKGTRNNFTGDISDVFQCIAECGTGGCGFEHQLASVARALGGNLGGWAAGAPAENAGFLRDGALLAVLWLTDEDDCSAPVDSGLFDTKQNSISDPLGPLNSFRCNEFGHLCAGVRPPRTPASNLKDCHSAEDAGKLIRVADFVSFFKTVKKDPGQLAMMAMAAPPEPYSVVTSGSGNPEMAPSCTSMNGSAHPAVRIKEFIDAFDKDGLFSTECADNYAPAMDRFGKEIAKRLGSQCIDDLIADTDPAAAGLQATCDVFDQTRTPSGVVTTALPVCAKGGTPCWKLVPNNRDCTVSGWELKVDRGGIPAKPGTVTGICCETCKSADDPRCRF